MADSTHSELGDFLRSRREKLSPQSLGILHGRRRTPGLRREEVAERAGIGVDWYIRLEQGRAVRPSPSTIDALARALRLTRDERAHLRALTESGGRRAFEPETVPGPIQRLVMGLAHPAYVTGRRWDVLAWNAAAEEIFAFGMLPDDERNTLISMLTRPATRKLFGAGWAAEARRMITQFRTTHDLWAGDPAFIDLQDRLNRGCPEFAAWWNAHDVTTPVAGSKLLHHPRKGTLRYEYASFQANDDPALKLIIYTPI